MSRHELENGNGEFIIQERRSLISKIIQIIGEHLKHECGRPAQLLREIKVGNMSPQPLQTQPDTFWIRAVPQWDEWPENMNLGPKAYSMDYRHLDNNRDYIRVDMHVPAFEHLVIEQIDKSFTCDITEVGGIGASKSSDLDLANIDELPEYYRHLTPSFLDPITKEHLEENMAHGEIRLDDMHFSYYPWSPRKLFWCNSGGSHHFAAACNQARQLKILVPVTGRLWKYQVDPTAVNELLAQWDMYLIPEKQVFGPFIKAMKALGCPFGSTRLPQNLHAGDNHGEIMLVVYLSKNVAKARRVADLLGNAGYPSFNEVLHEMVMSSNR